MPEVILAVDPGRQKFGYAVLKSDSTVLSKGIAPSSQMERVVRKTCAEFSVNRVVVGDRTASRESLAGIKKALGGMTTVVCPVDEDYSTHEGRYRYLREHRRGWRKLVPLGLQTPPEPYDDYAAVVLGERYLKGKREKDRGGR